MGTHNGGRKTGAHWACTVVRERWRGAETASGKQRQARPQRADMHNQASKQRLPLAAVDLASFGAGIAKGNNDAFCVWVRMRVADEYRSVALRSNLRAFAGSLLLLARREGDRDGAIAGREGRERGPLRGLPWLSFPAK